MNSTSVPGDGTKLGRAQDLRESSYPSAQALWFPAAGACVLEETALPAPRRNEVHVAALYSGISRGTESLVFHGQVPESEWGRMRGPHMAGDFSFPVKYGYSLVGRVVAGDTSLDGRAVFCLHPHQSALVTTRDMVTPLPHDLPPQRAILAANMETALNVVWDAHIQPGDRVAVFGAGVVGALVAYLARRIIGTDVLLIDPNTARASLADALDVPFADRASADASFDVLINASASSEALCDALGLAGFEARLVEASWHGEREVTLPLGGAFHSKRLSLVSSQVGSVPPDRRARWPLGRRLAKALDLLRDARLDALISGETPFADIAKTYPAILADPDTLCHSIRY